MASKVRLFVDHPLGEGQSVRLTRDQSTYLFAVMRLPQDAVLTVFNGKDGAWDATVAVANKRGGVLQCQHQTAQQTVPPDLWLVFAPIKKARMEFLVEKAVELGAGRLVPVETAHTNERFRLDKAQAHAIEAAEQCGATYVPDVAPMATLADLLGNWPAARGLMFCDEGLTAEAATLPDDLRAPAAIIVGPEGGFSSQERALLRSQPFAHPVSLGPRILRAETAALAALVRWQSAFGDW